MAIGSRSLVALLAILAGACGTDSATPAPTPAIVSIALSLSSLTLPRYASVQTTVRVAKSDGTSEDVTNAATWTSSAPDVVTVRAGVVTASGLGRARVTAQYNGWSASFDVVTRRNTRVVGAVTVAAIAPGGIHAVEARLDGRLVNGQSFSGLEKSWTMLVGTQSWAAYDTSVAPGSHTLSARITVFTQSGLQPGCASQSGSYLEVRDADTSEVLTRIALPVQEQTGQSSNGVVELTWNLTIEEYQ